MKTTTNTRLWIGLNGNTVCDKHAGVYLAAAIKADPEAIEHETALDSWLAIDSSQAPLPCEDCTPWSSL